VEVKYKRFVAYLFGMLIGIIPFLVLCIGVYDYLSAGHFSIPLDILLIILALLIATFIAQFSFFPNFTVVFSNSGILKRNKVFLGPIKIIDKERLYSWDSVRGLDYWSWGFLWGYIITANMQGSKHLAAVLNVMFTNKDKALAVALEHLPQYKISPRARMAIERKDRKSR